MITNIQYITERNGVTSALSADKDVKQRNAWHLKSITGNGMPPTSTLGDASHGLAGKSYNGLSIEGREVDAELYADGYSPAGAQELLSGASRIVSTDNEALGVLRLRNGAGDWFRIPAKCVQFDVSKEYRRSALCGAVFDCPFPYFEDDTLQQEPLYAVEGGKEYPIGEGLERPYTFGDISGTAQDQTVVCYNAGDAAAPCTFLLFGAGLSRVEITNQTTGAAIIVSGMSVGGIEISTDENDTYARFADGSDASAYVSLFSNLSEFRLVPGANTINVKMEATSITAAGTEIRWRGRYTTCL